MTIMEISEFGLPPNAEQEERNRQAMLTNAARYATLRRLMLCSKEEQKHINKIVSSALGGNTVLDGQTFDKGIDLVGNYFASQLLSTPDDAA